MQKAHATYLKIMALKDDVSRQINYRQTYVVAGFDWGKFLHIVKTALEVANIEEL